MANYSLVINSKFRPFEYQELLAPVLMATQAHQAVEDAYADLSTKASIWDKMANETTDPKAHTIYKRYADDLQSYSDQLAQQGLTPTSRQAMLNMRRRYASDIVPIETAYNRRAADIKAQQEAMMRDPTHFFSRMANQTSLDTYLDNPNLDILSENYSGDLLERQVAKEAEALAKAARNDPKMQTQLRHLLGFNYETIRQTGFSPEAVQEAILRSPNANPILTSIVDKVMESSGISKWNYTSPEEKERIWNRAVSAASRGLWAAVGQTQYGTVVDDAAKMAAEEAQAKRVAAYKHGLDNPPPTPESEPRRGWNFLEINGDLSSYKEVQSKLTAEGGGLKASYFGKSTRNFANPIKVYDEVKKAQDRVRQQKKPLTGTRLSGTGLYEAAHSGGSYTDTAALSQAAKEVMNKYGVSKVLSYKEYSRLKELGFTDKSTFNDFRNDYSRRVNERASQWRHESVNLNETALKERGNTFRGYLNYMENYDKWSGQAYLMAANGTKGEPIKSLSDLGIESKDDLKNAELTDVFYSRQVPGMIHSQFGGVEIYTNPNAYGSEAAKIVGEADRLLNMSDAHIKNTVSRMYGLSPDAFTAEQARDFVAQNTTAKLKDALRAYGKGRSTTDSGI